MPRSPPIISSCAATSTPSRRLLEALPSPVWARDAAGRLTWVNAAYARAVEARDGADAVARNLEILDSSARDGARAAHTADASYEARLPVIVAGTRRIFQVIDRASPGGSAGIGIDVTEVEAMRAELTRMTEAHRRTLDQLSTAVAIFTADQRLAFYNAAYPRAVGTSIRRSSIPSRPTPACSTACAPRASCPSRPISANGRTNCTTPTVRSSRDRTNGTCPTAARCASSRRRTRKAASPICSTT